MGFESRAKVRVRYQETDQMGVVYHTNYIVWFEVGRTEWMRNVGFSYKKLEEHGVILPVTAVNCRYMKSAKYDDVCMISTKIESFSPARLKFYYQIFREQDEELLAEGYSEHCFVNVDGKVIRLHKAVPDIAHLIEQNMCCTY